MDKSFEIKKPSRENPFEDEVVAREWISSVENEKDMFRDKEIYPRLEKWVGDMDEGLVMEIGSGQGICSSKLGNFKGRYLGIEPSKALVKRAKDLYEDDQRDFLVGEAYHLPVESEAVDGGFSVMVWFHLEDLNVASAELARVLKPDGRFLIVTANPETKEVWESFYFDYEKQGKVIIGKVNVPGNPMSKNIHYQHTREEIFNALEGAGLEIDKVESFGLIDDKEIFLSIEGRKK